MKATKPLFVLDFTSFSIRNCDDFVIISEVRAWVDDVGKQGTSCMSQLPVLLRVL